MSLYEGQYSMMRIQIAEADESDTVYVFFNKGQDEILHFEIKMYPQGNITCERNLSRLCVL